MGQAKTNLAVQREFTLSLYLCLISLLEGAAFFFLVPRFVANLYYPIFSLPYVAMIPIVAAFILFSIFHIVRFARKGPIRIWQLLILIGCLYFTAVFALGESYYLIFSSFLSIGYFWNGFFYDLLLPIWTMYGVVELIYRNSHRYREWYEHCIHKRWNETYYDYDG